MNIKEVQSVRLTTDEREFLNDYLEDHFDGVFSHFVHSAIKQEKELIHKNKNHNFFEDFKQDIFSLGIGAIIFLFGINQNELLSFLILFLMGVFFISSSLIAILLKIKRRNDKL